MRGLKHLIDLLADIIVIIRILYRLCSVDGGEFTMCDDLRF